MMNSANPQWLIVKNIIWIIVSWLNHVDHDYSLWSLNCHVDLFLLMVEVETLMLMVQFLYSFDGETKLTSKFWWRFFSNMPMFPTEITIFPSFPIFHGENPIGALMFRTHDDSGGGRPARWEVPGGSLRREVPGSAWKTDPKNLWG